MTKILLTNIYNFHNKGEMAQLYALRNSLPNNEFTTAPFYSFVSKKECEKLGINIAGRVQPLSKNKLFSWAAIILARTILWKIIRQDWILNRELLAYKNCDMIIDLGGDTFSDVPSVKYTLIHCFSLLPAITFGKPYIICSQSIGKFKTFYTRALAKFILNRAKAITPREQVTKNYLANNLKIKNKKTYVLDLAFLMEPEKVDNFSKPIIGINPSQSISRWMFPECNTPKEKYEKYISLMTELVAQLAIESEVILIPHVCWQEGMQSFAKTKDPDDRIAARNIYTRLKNQARVKVINVNYNTAYTKGIISQCQLLINCRMHASIAGISTGVPTVALSYGYKTTELAKDTAIPWLEVVRVHNKNYDELLEEIMQKVAIVKQNKPEEAEKIRKVNELQGAARMNINLIKNIAREKTRELIGSYKNCWISHSTNKEIRQKAASGGTITSLLYYALENKEVEAVVSLCNLGLNSVPTKWRIPYHALNYAGSIYSSSNNDLSEMIKLSKSKNLAVVGLPCQVKVLRKLYPDNFYIGLFCCHRIKREGIEFFLKHYHLNGNHVNYRAKINGKTGLLAGESFFSTKQYWSRFFNLCFIPKQCLKCKDQTAEDADISVGDAWGFTEVEKGLNAVIVRTKRGEELFKSTYQSKQLNIKEISSQDIINTQKGFIHLKKSLMSSKLRAYVIFRTIGNAISNRPVLHPLLDLWLDLAVKETKEENHVVSRNKVQALQ